MSGIITVVDGRYIGEHKCPIDDYERRNRQNFYNLQVSHGASQLIKVEIERESCLDYCIRMNEQAKRVAFTSAHPAVQLYHDALNHLNESDFQKFRETETGWEPS